MFAGHHPGQAEQFGALRRGQVGFAAEQGRCGQRSRLLAETFRLAVTSEERVPVIDAPTLTEEGIDLVFTNWRGLLAAPGLTDAEIARLVNAVSVMHDSPEWMRVLEDNSWTDAFITGDDFSTFFTEQDTRVADVLKTLGLV
ncbi:tripartite tricarboxylate transporter substrate-binding protein [Cryobacterium sp. Y82]|uniref:tripartite tricarboxylate transporter substrate-binding protein n=1 Tax=Cryobacterium sp. Y82 TaxID=2045017 RepID=UPI001E4EBDD6|nr:tripartite tricarboxylate transporter substrate-binding protein [Cryobacterium sp. Y82]